MQFPDYLSLLRRRAFLIVIASVFGVAGAALATSQQTKMYRTRTQLIVSVTEVGPGGGGQISRRPVAVNQATALAQLASTPTALRAAELASGVTGASSASATTDETSPFINVVVTGTDPRSITEIANVFAEVLPRVQQALNQGDPGIRVALTSVRPAEINDVPISPRPKRNLAVGLLLGLLLGIASAVARESLDDRLRDSGDVERATGLLLLGTIPTELDKELLPASTHPHSVRAEAYRLVRTNLQFTDVAGMPKCVLITSASPGDGKTSLATNLAASCALGGERVVIVDADLRKPRVAEHFGVRNHVGLSTVLAGGPAVGTMQQALDGAVAVLPSGPTPPNPSELLGSGTMRELLAQLVRDYDRVIVDGPPVLAVADAVKLASLVAGVLVVVRIGSTTATQIERTKGSLQLASARILGIVANGVSPGEDRAYGYGAYAGYSHTKPTSKTSRKRSRGRRKPSPGAQIVPLAPLAPPSEGRTQSEASG